MATSSTLDIPVHAVRFYPDSASLCHLVAAFVGDGLIAGDGAVVVATATHREGIMENLRQRAIDAAECERAGDMVLLDAHELLERIVVDEMPDRTRLRAIVAPILQQTSRGGQRRVRVYGEIVDLLCKAQRLTAAIRLERLWNDLAKTMPFSLLCGYAIGNRYAGAAVDEICGQHSHVVGESGVATSL